MCVHVGFVALGEGALGGGYRGDVLEDGADGFGGVCIEGPRPVCVRYGGAC